MSDPISARLLEAVATTLKQNVKPVLDNPESRLQLDIALRTLDFLAARQTLLADNLRELIADLRRDLSEIAALLRAHGDGDAAARIDAALARPAAQGDHLPALEAERYALELIVCDLAPRLVALATRDGVPEASAAVRNIVARQARFIAKQDPESVQGHASVFGGGRLQEEATSTATTIDDASLTAYVRARFPERSGLRVDATSNVPGGYSKRTVFFTLHADGDAPQRCVLRMDLPGPERSVKDEYPLLCKLHGAGLPVPEPFWLETDPDCFGGPFMVSARCNGTTDPAELLADPAKAESFARDLAHTLARLHAVDVSDLYPEAATLTAGECLRREVIRYFDHYRKHARHRVPQPLLELEYAWLLDNIPDDSQDMRPCLVHTDVGFHNMLIDNGRLSAVLDWETSHVSDHAEELYYTKPFVTRIMDWDRFLQHYQEAGGRPLSTAAERFHDVWRGARIAGNSARLRATFETDMPNSIAYALFGYVFARRIELDSANTLASFV